MTDDGRKPRIRRTTCSVANLPARNPTWNALGTKTCLNDEKRICGGNLLYIFNVILCPYLCCTGSRDSIVSIATCYGLDGPGIEFRSGRDFPHLDRPTPGPTQPLIQWVPRLSWGKAAGAWR